MEAGVEPGVFAQLAFCCPARVGIANKKMRIQSIHRVEGQCGGWGAVRQPAVHRDMRVGGFFLRRVTSLSAGAGGCLLTLMPLWSCEASLTYARPSVWSLVEDENQGKTRECR